MERREKTLHEHRQMMFTFLCTHAFFKKLQTNDTQSTSTVYSYLLAVFVGRFVVIPWNRSLIFTLHQLITVVSHELTDRTHENRVSDTMGVLSYMFVICLAGGYTD